MDSEWENNPLVLRWIHLRRRESFHNGSLHNPQLITLLLQRRIRQPRSSPTHRRLAGETENPISSSWSTGEGRRGCWLSGGLRTGQGNLEPLPGSPRQPAAANGKVENGARRGDPGGRTWGRFPPACPRPPSKARAPDGAAGGDTCQRNRTRAAAGGRRRGPADGTAAAAAGTGSAGGHRASLGACARGDSGGGLAPKALRGGGSAEQGPAAGRTPPPEPLCGARRPRGLRLGAGRGAEPDDPGLPSGPARRRGRRAYLLPVRRGRGRLAGP